MNLTFVWLIGYIHTNSQTTEETKYVYITSSIHCLGEFTDQEIYSAFVAFDLDKNNFVGMYSIWGVL